MTPERGSTAKDTDSLWLPGDITHWQRVARYSLVQRLPRTYGKSDLTIGLMVAAMGLLFMNRVPLAEGLVPVGLTLSAVGAWLLFYPAASGLLGLTVHGVAQTVVWVAEAAVFMAIAGPMMIVAAAPAILGVQILLNRKNYAAMLSGPAPREGEIERIGQIHETLGRIRNNDPNVIALRSMREVWTGHLWPDFAAFSVMGGRGWADVVVADRSTMTIEPKEQSPNGREWKVDYRIGDRSGSGTITTEHLRRYQAWLE